MTRTCTVEGCDGKHHSKGLCGMHYRRQLKYGRLHRITEKRGKCKYCDKKSVSRNLCIKHYNRIKRHGSPYFRNGKEIKQTEGNGMLDIGLLVQLRRERLDISQYELAKKSGVNKDTIRRLELNLTNPHFDVLEAVCGALGLEIKIEERK
jgi:DNA-binding XRE family transcriptional regulator